MRRKIVSNKRLEVIRDEGMDDLEVIRVTNKISGVMVSLLLSKKGNITVVPLSSTMEVISHNGVPCISIVKK